jgi:hypothetical protein
LFNNSKQHHENVILFATLAITAIGCAQSKATKKYLKWLRAFSKEYPNTKVDWDIEKGGFEAEFKLNGKEASVDYIN